ncbi:hypothetical protein F5Y10DRAFT_285801 [Nemania abortiva]|nr:hypothetical protein F5Y10DRAFT_285801 [Nemania abortiva]
MSLSSYYYSPQPSPRDEERRRISRMIQYCSQDMYFIYNACVAAPGTGIVGDLKAFRWPGHESFVQFLKDNTAGAPHVCFVRNDTAWRTSMLALRAALRQLVAQNEGFQNKNQYSVLFAKAISHALDAQTFFGTLIRDIVDKLRPLIDDLDYITIDHSVEQCLEALEAAREIRSPGTEAIPHYFFIEGIDRAWDRNSGYELTYSYLLDHHTPAGRQRLAETFRPTEEDLELQEKVQRMALAVNRLFAGRGKVVYFVSQDSREHEYLVQRGETAPSFEISEFDRKIVALW